MMAENAIPLIPRGVRIQHDHVRDRWVLQAPERAIAVDDIGLAILREIDGQRSFGIIVGGLAEKYAAPRDAIAGDVSDFIGKLCDRRILEVAP